MHTTGLDTSLLFKNCDSSCPSFYLLTEERKKQIKSWLLAFSENLSQIDKVRLILLGESIPDKRYFYDVNSDYTNDGLRYDLRKGLGINSDTELFTYLQKKGIVILDCALCPLHRIKDCKKQRHSATHCFKLHAEIFIKNHPNIPIYSFFPSNRGLLKTYNPSLSRRINREASFKNIQPIIDYIKNMN